MFWLLVFVIIAVAIAFILYPLLGQISEQAENRSAQNIIIAKEQKASLLAAMTAGEIAEVEYQQSLSELKQNLAKQISETSDKVTSVISPSTITSGIILFVIPIIVITMYLSLGNPDAVRMHTVSPPFVASAQATVMSSQQGQVADVGTLFEKLKQRLQNNPNDGAGWKMMGLSYMHFKQYDKALDAYQRAARLLPDDASIADAIARVEQARSDKPVAETNRPIQKQMIAPNGAVVDVGAMVERLRQKLEDNPDNLAGWMMLGRSYTNLGFHDKAVDAYKNALKLNPDNLEIQTALANAKTAASKM